MSDAQQPESLGPGCWFCALATVVITTLVVGAALLALDYFFGGAPTIVYLALATIASVLSWLFCNRVLGLKTDPRTPPPAGRR